MHDGFIAVCKPNSSQWAVHNNFQIFSAPLLICDSVVICVRNMFPDVVFEVKSKDFVAYVSNKILTSYTKPLKPQTVNELSKGRDFFWKSAQTLIQVALYISLLGDE